MYIEDSIFAFLCALKIKKQLLKEERNVEN